MWMSAVSEGFACPSWSAAEREVGKITLDRLLIGTQPSVKASELVRSQRGRRPLGLVEIRATSGHGLWRVGRQARTPTPRNAAGGMASDGPLPGAEGDGLRVACPGEGPRGMRLAKWPRFWKRQQARP